MQVSKRKGGAAPVAHTPPSCLETYSFLGRVGKGNIPGGILSLLILAGVLGGCDIPGRISRHIGTGETLPLYGLEGRWAGPVTAEDASCGAPATGLMSVEDGSFAFDPFQGTTVIKGVIQEGTFSGTLTRPGASKQSLSISFTGRARQDGTGNEVVKGYVASGRCRWEVTLKRA